MGENAFLRDGVASPLVALVLEQRPARTPVTPLSEADPEIRSAVVALVGSCRCRGEFKIHWKGHVSDEIDPKCAYHAFGEGVADLVRDNRRLRRIVNQTNIHRQLKKAP